MNLLTQFSRFPENWQILPFSEAVADITGGNIKIQREEYLSSGLIPIVDQGQKQYGGFTDNIDAVCKTNLPAIIFGDHTKTFKYIEQPFALGADGVKLLKPKKEYDIKFLFYYLSQLSLPNVGYSRHFKFLKEVYVPLPPLETQKQIASILEKADNLRKQCQQIEQELNALAQSVFLDMFGDPEINPKRWQVCKMKDVIDFKGGSQPSKLLFKFQPAKGYVRLVQIRDFKSDKYITYIPESSSTRRFSQDDVMVARYGPPVFQILRGMEGAYNVALMKAAPKGGITKDFIFYLLQLPFYHDRVVASSERTAGQTGVNLDLLNNFLVPLPPINIQNEITARMVIIEKLKKYNKASHQKSNYLFNALLQKAFTGELNIKSPQILKQAEAQSHHV